MLFLNSAGVGDSLTPRKAFFVERTAPIVTITSDFGQRDYHLALIKGSILRACPSARIIDISSEVSTYNIVEGAFLFQHAWRAFPVGSIHLLSINDFGIPDSSMLVFTYEGHHFVGPDNGIFSLIFPERPANVFAMETSDLPVGRFPLADWFSKAVGHLSQDFPAGGLGKAIDGWVDRITFQAVTGPNLIRGTVVYIDQFDNVILNINRELFERVGRNRPFKLFFKRHSPITTLSQHFHDVPIGEILCHFNSADLLEIAINMDKAASLLGLKVEDTVQVDFKSAAIES